MRTIAIPLALAAAIAMSGCPKNPPLPRAQPPEFRYTIIWGQDGQFCGIIESPSCRLVGQNLVATVGRKDWSFTRFDTSQPGDTVTITPPFTVFDHLDGKPSERQLPSPIPGAGAEEETTP